MFTGGSAFNADISKWNTARVRSMYQVCSLPTDASGLIALATLRAAFLRVPASCARLACCGSYSCWCPCALLRALASARFFDVGGIGHAVAWLLAPRSLPRVLLASHKRDAVCLRRACYFVGAGCARQICSASVHVCHVCIGPCSDAAAMRCLYTFTVVARRCHPQAA
jgi:surface protein